MRYLKRKKREKAIRMYEIEVNNRYIVFESEVPEELELHTFKFIRIRCQLGKSRERSVFFLLASFSVNKVDELLIKSFFETSAALLISIVSIYKLENSVGTPYVFTTSRTHTISTFIEDQNEIIMQIVRRKRKKWFEKKERRKLI